MGGGDGGGCSGGEGVVNLGQSNSCGYGGGEKEPKELANRE
jgi:hypothetical protein